MQVDRGGTANKHFTPLRAPWASGSHALSTKAPLDRKGTTTRLFGQTFDQIFGQVAGQGFAQGFRGGEKTQIQCTLLPGRRKTSQK